MDKVRVLFVTLVSSERLLQTQLLIPALRENSCCQPASEGPANAGTVVAWAHREATGCKCLVFCFWSCFSAQPQVARGRLSRAHSGSLGSEMET